MNSSRAAVRMVSEADAAAREAKRLAYRLRLARACSSEALRMLEAPLPCWRRMSDEARGEYVVRAMELLRRTRSSVRAFSELQQDAPRPSAESETAIAASA